MAPTHTYLSPGEYTVTLTVVDNYGLVSLPVTDAVTVVARTAKELEEEAAAELGRLHRMKTRATFVP